MFAFRLAMRGIPFIMISPPYCCCVVRVAGAAFDFYASILLHIVVCTKRLCIFLGLLLFSLTYSTATTVYYLIIYEIHCDSYRSIRFLSVSPVSG